MGKIQDGKGKNGDASVSSVQRLNVSAKTAPRTFYSSRDFGLSFVASYEDMTCTAGDHVAYLKNTSNTRNLFILDIDFNSVEAVKWKVFSCSGTAAAGATVIPSNLNLSSNKVAEATAMSGDTAITGLTADRQVGGLRTPALDSRLKEFNGALVLGPNDAIVVEYDTGTTGLCGIEILFYYEDLEHA